VLPTVKDIVVKTPSDAEAAKCKTWPIWSCDVSTFDWDYTQTETCLLLEGKVTVTDCPADEDSVSFGVWDMVVFPVVLAGIWEIKEPVRKYHDFT